MRIEWSEVPVLPGMRTGSTRQGVAGEKLSVVRVIVAADSSFKKSALHTHGNEQLLIVQSGSLELEVDGERYWVRAGDLAVFPIGSVHGAVGVGNEGAEYYEIFSPPRYDQLPGYFGSSPLQFA